MECIKNCEYCNGTGEVSKSTYDADSNQWIDDDTQPCPNLVESDADAKEGEEVDALEQDKAL